MAKNHATHAVLHKKPQKHDDDGEMFLRFPYIIGTISTAMLTIGLMIAVLVVTVLDIISLFRWITGL
jgi:hypothetical protein